MRHIIPISGKDSLATAILQSNINPNLPYEYIFNDTGLELPETYQWLDNIGKQLDINIIRIGESLLDIIWLQGILPSPKVRFCTRMSKIYPMENFLSSGKSTVYFGLRYDERNRGGYHPSSRKIQITPKYPLIENQIDLEGVYNIVPTKLLPPHFFWPKLFNKVKEFLGPLGEQLKEESLTDFEKRVLFSWRSRPNCYNCFFMRYYEFVGLHEFHPELFVLAKELEDNVGGEGYTIKTKSLVEIIQKADYYINRRAKEVAKVIRNNAQKTMFENTDNLSDYNCGIFCGK